MDAPPRVSVVIPSHDRPESLARVLEGLRRQTVPPEAIEVIVVLDGPSAASEELLDAWRREGRLPRLAWLVQARAGQAAARNAGAERAAAPVVLFVDDDIVPEPELVAAHLTHHDGSAVVVHGDSVFVRDPREGLYPIDAWGWWEDLFRHRAHPDHRPAMRDFCAGNVSVRRADFLRLGGFDPAFTGYGGEDYELGHRLLAAGARFVGERRARARHHHRASLAKVLRNTRQEAHGDLLLGRKHPALAPGLRLAQPLSRQTRLMARVALQAPALGDLLVGAATRLMPALERRRLRRRWYRLFKLARNYAYWRGVRDALGSWRAFTAWRAALPPLPAAAIDVARGLPATLPPIPVDVPSELEVRAAGATVGRVRLPGPTSEPLTPWVVEQLVWRLGPELAAAYREADAREGRAAPWWLDPAALPAAKAP